MTDKSNNPFHFWHELKRRKVIRVIPVYAAASFILLELVDILTEPLRLPEWTINLVLVLLCIGFVISIIFSWVYDLTPEGVQKTKPVKEEQKVEKPSTSNVWKVATYVSVVIIVGLLITNIFGSKKLTEDLTELGKSIAVLPFKNFSAELDQEFMCDGLTDEIINHLYKIKSFDKVVSLNSVLTFKGTNKKTPEIADELEVNYILEGTYKKIGEQLRVTAQLIEAKSDKHLWQNEYDQPYIEIIAIQADIALQIANHVKAFITSSEEQNIQKIPTTNQEAYELYQQALHLRNTGEYNSLGQLFDLVLKAIELDPSYADAYALAGVWTLYTGVYSGRNEMSSVAWEALRFFEKALELDENNFRVHYGMGLMDEWVRWDYIKAEEEYLRLTDLKPNYSPNYTLYVEFFLKMNRLEDALLYLERVPEIRRMTSALELLLKIHVLSGNKIEAYTAINEINKSVEEKWYHRIGEHYIWLEDYDSARIFLESAMQTDFSSILLPRFQACLALAYHKTKNHQQAQVIINQLITKSDTTSAGSPDYFTGWYYSGIGEVESAFYYLEKAYKNRSPEMPWLKVDPVFNNLKADDRYWDLYERTGHKAYDEYMASMKK